MQKEQLLSLLDTSAREAFERAKPLARARGGVLTPLHILVALLEDSAPASEQSSELLHSATDALLSRYTQPGETITIPKDTQAVISQAGEMAQAEGAALATPDHLLRAALASPFVRDALNDFAARPLQTAESAQPVARALTGSLKDYCA